VLATSIIGCTDVLAWFLTLNVPDESMKRLSGTRNPVLISNKRQDDKFCFRQAAEGKRKPSTFYQWQM
jgi:hypothetical protein